MDFFGVAFLLYSNYIYNLYLSSADSIILSYFCLEIKWFLTSKNHL